MAVMVETYDMLELDINLEVESDPEAVAIIEEMGLTGQQDLVNDTGGRQPYNRLTADQLIICATLFPSRARLSDYKEGPIPYRVLKEAQVAKKHFKFLYVFYDTPAEIKDPVLVGAHSEIYSWSDNPTRDYAEAHLIARWGDALESWGDLMAKATKRRFEKGVANFNNVMAHFEGIKKGIREGHIQVNPDMKPTEIIKMITGEEA
jgi:hypothetical protein